jgi:alkylated DNA nucleotide flippase Atl1
MTKATSWVEKLHDSKDLPKVIKLKDEAARHWKGGLMAIPAPLEVDGIMRDIPQGRLITINEIREKVAKKHKAEIGCPLTCGIFAWIVANAAEEERDNGKTDITPYWRTLKSGGFLNEKYPGGIEAQKIFLEKEGHRVVEKGKKYQVLNFEKSLV